MAWGSPVRPRRRSGWRPPPPPVAPPAGSYDPALDAQRAAAGRGLFDLEQDASREDVRDTVDYGLQREDIQRQQTYGLEDLGRSFDRGSADLGLARSRGQEDYDRNIGLLRRSFRQLGNRQGQQAAAYGVLRGGASLQAAQKRAANEALERQPIDTGFNRFTADNTQALGRLTEDRDRGVERLNTGTDTALGRLALLGAPPDAANPYGGRSFQDRATQLARAQRENAAFGIDLDAQRFYQAAGAGWEPPPVPREPEPRRRRPRRSPSYVGGR